MYLLVKLLFAKNGYANFRVMLIMLTMYDCNIFLFHKFEFIDQYRRGQNPK
jgi:hypothetical protein